MSDMVIDMRPVKAALRAVSESETHYRALCLAFTERANDDLYPGGIVLQLALLDADIEAGKLPPVSGLPAMAVRLMFMNLESEIEAHVTAEEWSAIEACREQVEARATT